ncbi:MAG: hypothetical protein QMD07_08750 [Thermodesulfovibrionales bacterium]|nr:hypothetical protein [Thermodesulfovibrionales bacterium]
MQGLADGYFIIPYTISDYLAGNEPGKINTGHPEFRKSAEDVSSLTKEFLSINGRKTASEFHCELGKIMWDNVGMSSSEESLTNALKLIPELREEFWENVKIPGSGAELNQELEKAGRTADFLEFAELMAYDALHRNESCGGHFRVEHQMPDGEAKRDDENFSYATAWKFKGIGKKPELHKELLVFENIEPEIRSYK